MFKMWRKEKITEGDALRVLTLVDRGLHNEPPVDKPLGMLTLSFAISYGMNERPYLDLDKKSVAPTLVVLSNVLNDIRWSSPEARACGLRQFAIAQLGTAGTLNEGLFVEKLMDTIIRWLLPEVFYFVASALEVAAAECDYKTMARLAKNHQSGEPIGALDAIQIASIARQVHSAAIKCGGRFWSGKHAAGDAADAAALAVEFAKKAVMKRSATNRLTHFNSTVEAGKALAYSTLAIRHAAYSVSMLQMPETCPSDVHARSADFLADSIQMKFAVHLVRLLLKMESPGSKFLYLAEQRKVLFPTN
jgi:hypothetical protein